MCTDIHLKECYQCIYIYPFVVTLPFLYVVTLVLDTMIIISFIVTPCLTPSQQHRECLSIINLCRFALIPTIKSKTSFHTEHTLKLAVKVYNWYTSNSRYAKTSKTRLLVRSEICVSSTYQFVLQAVSLDVRIPSDIAKFLFHHGAMGRLRSLKSLKFSEWPTFP